MSRSLLERLQRLPRPAVLLVGLALIVLIAWLDAMTGPKLALNVFYLLPVMLVAWMTGSTAYGLIAVLATFLVGPLEAYLDGMALLLSAGRRLERRHAHRGLLHRPAAARRGAQAASRAFRSSRSPTSSRASPIGAPSSMAAAREIERSRRYAHQLSLAYLDIDGFKAVNDRDGHAIGDRVLVAPGRRRSCHGALGRRRWRVSAGTSSCFSCQTD